MVVRPATTRRRCPKRARRFARERWSIPTPCSIERAGMLLTIDVGNTNITIGLYEGTHLAESWRLNTDHDRTSDEYGLLVDQLIVQTGRRRESIDGVIIASVVPVLTGTMER